MSLYNIWWIKFFLTKHDRDAVNVKPWLHLRRSCPVTLGGKEENEGHDPDYLKWPKTKYYQKTQTIHQLFYSWVGGNHNGPPYSKPSEVRSASHNSSSGRIRTTCIISLMSNCLRKLTQNTAEAAADLHGLQLIAARHHTPSLKIAHWCYLPIAATTDAWLRGGFSRRSFPQLGSGVPVTRVRKLVGQKTRWWVGCYIRYREEGLGGAPDRL